MQILISSNSSSIPRNIPIMTAFEFGKGRVLIMGDFKWILPEYLKKADNAQLMLNIFNWLAHRPIKIQSKTQIQGLIDTKF